MLLDTLITNSKTVIRLQCLGTNDSANPQIKKRREFPFLTCILWLSVETFAHVVINIIFKFFVTITLVFKYQIIKFKNHFSSKSVLNMFAISEIINESYDIFYN